jgi:hypothetical protein
MTNETNGINKYNNTHSDHTVILVEPSEPIIVNQNNILNKSEKNILISFGLNKQNNQTNQTILTNQTNQTNQTNPTNPTNQTNPTNPTNPTNQTNPTNSISRLFNDFFKTKPSDFNVYLDTVQHEIDYDTDDEDKKQLLERLKKANEKKINNTPIDIIEKLKSDINELEPFVNNKVFEWDESSIYTVKYWIKKLDAMDIIYRYILEKSMKMSNRVNLISTVSSFVLGILSAFKLAFSDDVFSTVSDVILMIFNFIIAIMSITAKKYLDNSRTDNIQLYLSGLNQFKISLIFELSNINKTMNGRDFISANQEQYIDIIDISKPELSLSEEKEAKQYYMKIRKKST